MTKEEGIKDGKGQSATRLRKLKRKSMLEIRKYTFVCVGLYYLISDEFEDGQEVSFRGYIIKTKQGGMLKNFCMLRSNPQQKHGKKAGLCTLSWKANGLSNLVLHLHFVSIHHVYENGEFYILSQSFITAALIWGLTLDLIPPQSCYIVSFPTG